MKKILLLIYFLLIFLTCTSQSQSAFDKSLNDISSDLAEKLSIKSKKQVVVLYITDINKSVTVAGKYLADGISANLVNDSRNFSVFDRDNLNEITAAKKLITDGYIDIDKAKELGKILSVQAIIIGNYTVLSNTIKLSLKALDSNNGLVIAASMKDLPLNSDAGALLGINVSTNGGSSNSNRGFNGQPLNSSEQYNNPETVNKECETKNTGDYCFMNNTSKNLKVNIHCRAGTFYDLGLTLSPGQTQCFPDMPTGIANYDIREPGGKVSFQYGSYPEQNNSPKSYSAEGQVNVERCKSKTFIIK